ncbi:hypothetical protein D081_1454 [Anaerovibrio sp. JC8]|uniref:hypothetical protein n=1 Tax=Anaerovibrio sp. JC8 TaxID=1240085 RepID=UPI000A0BC9BE|nr:hypothetical protein [Anaerovibrio sp. JC8]ORT99873.1 hypothetical protein D081_1454 [Anaerovibrio sp. JC8]
MKKLSCIFMMLLVCFAFNICQASVVDECALGGVALGMSRDDVKNICGDPTKTRDEFVEEWFYDDSFLINFTEGCVTSITTNENNGIRMPAGFTVGSNVKSLIKHFEQKYGIEPIQDSDEKMTYVKYLIFRPNQSNIILRVGYDKYDDIISLIHLYATSVK